MSLLQYSVCSLGNGNNIIAAKCWNSVVSAQLDFNICMGYSFYFCIRISNAIVK